MLSKFSVRKPFTVLVAVVICLVLGFLSFQNMSTDFLPNMEFPYALVMTTYPGASPEEVEKAVSEPVEQAMESKNCNPFPSRICQWLLCHLMMGRTWVLQL